MSVSTDANVLISAFRADDATPQCRALLANRHDWLVSDWALAEFAAVMGRDVRAGGIDEGGARKGFAGLDVWVGAEATIVHVTTDDVAAAARRLRRLDLNLRAPDALHVCIALRLGAALATADKKMIRAARQLGLVVIEP